MKFLCSNCKAKYQIADDKVVGRAVRIKCRKCGEIIDVAQNIAPPSLAPAAPSSAAETADAPASAPIAAPAAPKQAPDKPVARAPNAPPGGAPTSRPAAVPVKRPPAPSVPRGTAPPPPRTGGPTLTKSPIGQAAAPQALAPKRPAASVTEAAQAPLGGAADPLRRLPAVAAAPSGERGPGTAVFGGGLAGAFSAAVATPAPVAVAEVAQPQSADEWFVGVNGSPIGPIKLSELRAKAMAGAVGLESLVWKDGFEEWKPLGSFPELAAVIEEGLSSIHAAPAALVLATAAAARPDVVLADPFSRSASDNDTSRAVTTGTTSDWPQPQRKSNVVWAVLVVFIAIGLGLTIGFVFMPKQVVKVFIEKPGAAAQGASAPENPQTAQTPKSEGEEPSAGSGDGQPGQPRSKRPSKANGAPVAALPSVAEPPAKPAEALKGLGGLKLGGPALGGPAGTRPPTSGGPPLDASAVQAVVAKYSGSVKRACWQPALDSRDRNAPASASVSVQITVGTSGSVQGVTTSGDPTGYRGLASCIQQRVHGWQFPPTSESTTVNVPFKFFSQ